MGGIKSLQATPPFYYPVGYSQLASLAVIFFSPGFTLDKIVKFNITEKKVDWDVIRLRFGYFFFSRIACKIFRLFL